MIRQLTAAGATIGLGAAALLVPTAASAAPAPQERAGVKILSASWGTDNAVNCPSGASGLDNIPVTFSWFIKRKSIQVTDFTIIRSDGTKVHPTCALQFPPDEKDEAQTVNLIGNFGDSVSGPVPSKIKVKGPKLKGKPVGTSTWMTLPKLAAVDVDPISGGPFITDSWIIPAKIYKKDQNRCTTGTVFVRVMWSNGLTAYPTGDEVGQAVTDSYRAVFKKKNGKNKQIAPLAVADLHDHSTNANADNMQDLCLASVPDGARLKKIKIGANLIQDPNGDPNLAQNFRVS